MFEIMSEDDNLSASSELKHDLHTRLFIANVGL